RRAIGAAIETAALESLGNPAIEMHVISQRIVQRKSRRPGAPTVGITESKGRIGVAQDVAESTGSAEIVFLFFGVAQPCAQRPVVSKGPVDLAKGRIALG